MYQVIIFWFFKFSHNFVQTYLWPECSVFSGKEKSLKQYGRKVKLASGRIVIFLAIERITYNASVEDVQVFFNRDILSNWWFYLGSRRWAGKLNTLQHVCHPPVVLRESLLDMKNSKFDKHNKQNPVYCSSNRIHWKEPSGKRSQNKQLFIFFHFSHSEC